MSQQEEKIELTHYQKYGEKNKANINKEKICSVCGVITTASNFSNHKKTRFCIKVGEFKEKLKIENEISK